MVRSCFTEITLTVTDMREWPKQNQVRGCSSTQLTDEDPNQGTHIGKRKKAMNLRSALLAEEKKVNINLIV